MPTDVVMPKLGLTMEEGTLTAWLVADGAVVTAGVPLFSLETDKVEAEVEAEADGTLVHAVAEGTTVTPGTVVGQLLAPGSAPAGPAPPAGGTDRQATSRPAGSDVARRHRGRGSWPPSWASTSRPSSGRGRAAGSPARTSRRPPGRVTATAAGRTRQRRRRPGRRRRLPPTAPHPCSPRSSAAWPPSSGSTWRRCGGPAPAAGSRGRTCSAHLGRRGAERRSRPRRAGSSRCPPCGGSSPSACTPACSPRRS